MNLESIILKKLEDGGIDSMNEFLKSVREQFSRFPFATEDITKLLVHLALKERILPVIKKGLIERYVDDRSVPIEVLFYVHVFGDKSMVSKKLTKMRRRLKCKIKDESLREHILTHGKNVAEKKGLVHISDGVPLEKTSLFNMGVEYRKMIKEYRKNQNIHFSTKYKLIKKKLEEEVEELSIDEIKEVASFIELGTIVVKDWKLLPGPKIKLGSTGRFDHTFPPRLDILFKRITDGLVTRISHFLPLIDLMTLRITNRKLKSITENYFIGIYKELLISRIRRVSSISLNEPILPNIDESIVHVLFPKSSTPVNQTTRKSEEVLGAVDELLSHLINSFIVRHSKGLCQDIWDKKYWKIVRDLYLLFPSRVISKRKEFERIVVHGGGEIVGSIDYFWGGSRHTQSEYVINLEVMKFLCSLTEDSCDTATGASPIMENISVHPFLFDILPKDVQRYMCEFCCMESLCSFRLINKYMEAISRPLFSKRFKSHFETMTKDLVVHLESCDLNMIYWSRKLSKFHVMFCTSKASSVDDEDLASSFVKTHGLRILELLKRCYRKTEEEFVASLEGPGGYNYREDDIDWGEISSEFRILRRIHEENIGKFEQLVTVDKKGKVVNEMFTHDRIAEILLGQLLGKHHIFREGLSHVEESRIPDLQLWLNFYKFGDDVQLLVMKIFLKLISDSGNPDWLKRQVIKGCITCLWVNGYLSTLRNRYYGSEIYEIMNSGQAVLLFR